MAVGCAQGRLGLVRPAVLAIARRGSLLTAAKQAGAIFFVVGALAASGGIGGGGLFVPVLNLLLQFDAHVSTALSQALIFGASTGALLVNAPARHPYVDRPLIDVRVTAFLAPCEMAGAQLGVLLNRMLPSLVIFSAMTLVLSITGALPRTPQSHPPPLSTHPGARLPRPPARAATAAPRAPLRAAAVQTLRKGVAMLRRERQSFEPLRVTEPSERHGLTAAADDGKRTTAVDMADDDAAEPPSPRPPLGAPSAGTGGADTPGAPPGAPGGADGAVQAAAAAAAAPAEAAAAAPPAAAASRLAALMAVVRSPLRPRPLAGASGGGAADAEALRREEARPVETAACVVAARAATRLPASPRTPEDRPRRRACFERPQRAAGPPGRARRSPRAPRPRRRRRCRASS